MQIKLFTISLRDAESGEEELNRFLRGRQILELIHQFLPQGADSRWCFLVKYMDGPVKSRNAGNRQDRIDYRDVLDEASFARFCTLRKARKAVAAKEGVPAFALFTDKQMAELAKFEVLSLENMGKVEGIGSGKTDKYGAALLKLLNEELVVKTVDSDNEKSGEPL
ncbi:MAG: HRDC domain-containing protein [Pseudomonadota bacterium]